MYIPTDEDEITEEEYRRMVLQEQMLQREQYAQQYADSDSESCSSEYSDEYTGH